MRERSARERPRTDTPAARDSPPRRRPAGERLHDELSWRLAPADTSAVIRRRCAPCTAEDEELRREARPKTIEGVPVGARADPSESAAEALAVRALSAGREPAEAPAPAPRASVEAPAALKQRLGPGAPLEDGVRARMQAGFGSDFSSVRVHAGSPADALARRLSARAFTVGQEVAFAAGHYQPGTPDGDLLLAHELAHTLQPRPASAPALRRKPAGDEEPDAGDESEEEEAEPETDGTDIVGGIILALFGCGGGKQDSDKKDGGTTGPASDAGTGDAAKEAEKKEDKKEEKKKEDQPAKGADGVWTFPTKTALDVRKDAWKVKVRELYDASEKAAGPAGTTDPLANDLIRWLMGDPATTSTAQTSNPVADTVMLDGVSVTDEVNAQKTALANAMIKAKLPNLPGSTAADVLGSAYRNYAAQTAIWSQKWAFTRSNFDVVSSAAAATCADPEVKAGEKWNPPVPAKPAKPKDEKDKAAMGKWKTAMAKWTAADAKVTAQKKCWTKTLDDAGRAKEILQASSAPGVSRHHWGTDFDFWNVDPEDWKGTSKTDLTKVHDWLKPNASTFGFLQSFVDKPAGASTASAYGTRYFAEAWHWSYYPVAQALLEVSQQADVRKKLDAALKAKWTGSGSAVPDKFDYVSKHWQTYMDEVNQKP